MAVTHNFTDSADLAGGWSDDNGNPLCTWEWDQATGHILVTCGTKSRRLKLPHSESDLRGEQLRLLLEKAKAELKLDNLEVSNMRVEIWQPDAKFSQIVSRAFSDLYEFFHLTAPLGEVTTPITSGKTGSSRLRSRSKRFSACSFRFNSSKRC